MLIIWQLRVKSLNWWAVVNGILRTHQFKSTIQISSSNQRMVSVNSLQIFLKSISPKSKVVLDLNRTINKQKKIRSLKK
jgi:hypothetical protein